MVLFFLGELIGIEYLFNQTGKVLHDITSCTDDYGELTAESGPLSDIDQAQQDDGGFVEEEDDQTVASVDAVLATETESAGTIYSLCVFALFDRIINELKYN